MKKTSLLIFCLLMINGMFAQQKSSGNFPKEIPTKITVTTASEFHVTQSPNLLFDQKEMDKINSESAKQMTDRDHRKAQVFKFSAANDPKYGNDPATIQKTMGTRTPLAVIKKWVGISSGSQPLDPTGAVGMTQYVQAINTTPYAVYDKTGTGTAVYNGSIGTATGTGTDGDPVVAYDKFADRWVVAQLNGNGFGMAVSKTNNPAGAWSAYKFTASNLPDYIKFGVWSDGYYMCANNGGTMFVLERSVMIAGTAGARMITAKYTMPTGAGGGFWLPLPGDADGVIPPAGLRCPLFGYTDDGWGGSEIDGVKVWSVGATWGTTPTANVTLDATVPTAAFDASYQSSWNDVTQPGSQKLDGIGGICMYRAQWNSFVGTNRVVLNWGVLIGSAQRSIKWVELRQDQTSKVWSLFQEGIYTPDAADRWLGSIAMNCNGDIALCYSMTSSSIPMCLAYTGRVPTDPKGTMSLAETVVFPGTGSISGSNRIGDYAETSLDPADGNTFWHVGTYCNSGRKTGIYSFQIAPCANGIDKEKPMDVEFSAYQSGNSITVKVSQLPSNDNYMVQLFEISGKKISEKPVASNSNAFETNLDVSSLASGVYLVRIGTGDFQRVKKVVLK